LLVAVAAKEVFAADGYANRRVYKKDTRGNGTVWQAAQKFRQLRCAELALILRGKGLI
jgi:hypothetical protein